MSSPTTDRIDSLDVLRGFAVLGILVMNIQTFSMPMAAYVNPTAWGSLSGIDAVVWYLSHLLTDQKMMGLFSMLFGAGIILFTERAAGHGKSAAAYHYRRNLWLLIFGAIHAYLLWYGDVLFLYAVCAFMLYPLRNMKPKKLMIVGVIFLSISSMVYLLTAVGVSTMSDEQIAAEIMSSWSPSAEQLATEIAAYQGNWTSQMSARLPATREMHGFVFFIWGIWRAAGMMLLGMALYKFGILSAKADDKIYWRLLAAGVLIGLPVIAYGIHWNIRNEWALNSLFIGSQFNYWASVLVSVGWMAALVLILKKGALTWLTSRLAAVGRMAFSNYIMHTIICGYIFYGHGLGLFSEVERSGQILIVIAIWILQLTMSPIWLRHFRFGPLEWLWRSLTYWQAQPFKRTI
jgi:uncharacterized protein